MPLETNKNEEGITGVNFLTSFLKVNQKKTMLKKQDEIIPQRGKACIKKLSEMDDFQMSNTVRSESQK